MANRADTWCKADKLVGTGRRVRATISGAHDPGHPVTVEGTLASLDMFGEFVIDTDDGRRYCWPLLGIEEVA